MMLSIGNYGDSYEIEEGFSVFHAVNPVRLICMGSQLSEDISDE